MEVQWRRAAAYVVCRDEQRRLLLTRFSSPGAPDHGKWTMPGGGMEWGESPSDTARRELEEETGLVAQIGPILGVVSYWLTPEESLLAEAGHVIGIVFEGVEPTGRLRTRWHEGTTDGASWFTLDEIADLPTVPLVDLVLDFI